MRPLKMFNTTYYNLVFNPSKVKSQLFIDYLWAWDASKSGLKAPTPVLCIFNVSLSSHACIKRYFCSSQYYHFYHPMRWCLSKSQTSVWTDEHKHNQFHIIINTFILHLRHSNITLKVFFLLQKHLMRIHFMCIYFMCIYFYVHSFNKIL